MFVKYVKVTQLSEQVTQLSEQLFEQVLFRVKSADLGLRDSRLRDRPMAPFILLNTSLRCSLNDKRLSSIIPRWLCDVAW